MVFLNETRGICSGTIVLIGTSNMKVVPPTVNPKAKVEKKYLVFYPCAMPQIGTTKHIFT